MQGLLAVEKREMELRANKEYERTHGVKGNQVKEAQQVSLQILCLSCVQDTS